MSLTLDNCLLQNELHHSPYFSVFTPNFQDEMETCTSVWQYSDVVLTSKPDPVLCGKCFGQAQVFCLKLGITRQYYLPLRSAEFLQIR